jgi:purine nucleosidase
VLRPEEDVALRQLGRLGKFASEINRDVQAFASTISGHEGYDLPDPVAMAVALNEALITDSSHRYMEVSTDRATRGQTFADQRHPLRTPNLRVVTKVDEAAFKKELFSLLREARQR